MVHLYKIWRLVYKHTQSIDLLCKVYIHLSVYPVNYNYTNQKERTDEPLITTTKLFLYFPCLLSKSYMDECDT